jgi:adenine-specific DNA-methyltransferase
MATLDFKGKALVQNYHLSVKYHELVPKRDRSLTDKVRLDDNLIIHGDNLKALKALLPTYAGQVKCIYIDPPYNTGNEGWAYNDNVNSPMMQEWLGKAVDREDLTRHDKWLCMMLPRLKLLRELLQNDGIIFISVDDNEIHRLRSLMDEVFGEENFVETIIWKKRSGPPNDKPLGAVHEYIVAYARSISEMGLFLRPRTEEQIARYKNPDKHPKGPWTPGDLMANIKGGRYVESLRYQITNPKTGEKHWPGKDGNWRFNEEKMLALVKADEISFGMSGDGRPKLKRFLCDVKEGTAVSTLWDSVPFTHTATEEIVSILGSQTAFDTPKPVDLIVEIVRLGAEKNDIVLDGFGGSGTTAHAVLALNKEDGGNRKFILVECEDYADSITAERVRRVIKGVKGASDEHLKKGLGGTFSYFELGKAIELDSILDGKNLPSYLELARYVFYTATGEEFDERKVNEKKSFVGESKTHEVYLFYQPDLDYLKKTALTLERAESLGKLKDKRRLVFAPTKYLDQEQLDALRIDFAQLPFEIYKLAQ